LNTPSRHARRSCLAWLCLTLAGLGPLGCGDSDRKDPGPVTPGENGDASAFCEEFWDAVCDHAELCGCDPQIVGNCRGIQCAGPLFEGSDDPIERGTLIFDPAAAGALFARLRNPSTSCDGVYADLGLDSYSALSFGGVFRGTLPEGSPCSLQGSKQRPGVTECVAGSLCLPDGQGEQRCLKLAGVGESCSVNPNEPDSNCLLRKGPDSDNEFESAFDALVCLPSAGSSSSGTCATNAPNGASCDDDDQCESGRCVTSSNDGPSTCAQALSSGSRCEASSDCETGYCGSGNAGRLCVPQAADGVECVEDQACRSGACMLDGVTGMGVCAPAPVPAAVPIGGACSRSDDCASLFCYDGRCAPRVCGTLN